MSPSTEEIFDGLLRAKGGKLLKQRYLEIVEESTPEAGRDYDDNLKRQNAHDALVDASASAFGPASRIYRETGFGLVTSEPLKEESVKCVDFLVYNSLRKIALFVECKASVSSPSRAVRDVYESAGVIKERLGRIEEKIGDKITIPEYVLCVPAEHSQDIVRYLEQAEAQDPPPEGEAVRLWQVNRFVDQTLQLYTRLNWRAPPGAQHHDAHLTKVLAEGIPVDGAELYSKVYPSSHPVKVAKEIILRFASRNLAASTRLQSFGTQDLDAFVGDPSSLLHYSREEICRALTDRFLREGIDLGLVVQTGAGGQHFDLQVEGRTTKTLLRNYERAYREAAVRRIVESRAKSKVVDEHQKHHPDITEYR